MNGVQALRFIAAMMVVIYHVSLHYTARKGELDVTFLKYFLYSGVDIFFVISGLVIWESTNNNTTAKEFFLKRTWRIYSGYLPALAICGLLIAISSSDKAKSAISVLPSILLLPIPPQERMLDVSWTLTYELIFYIAMAACLLFKRRSTVIALLLAGGIYGVISSLAGAKQANFAAGYLTSPLLFEFAIGCFISFILSKYKTKSPKVYVAAGFSLILMAGIAAFKLKYLPGGKIGEAARVIAFGVPAALIVYGCACLRAQGTIADSLKRLGDASYAIYLLHMPVLVFTWHALPVAANVWFFFKNLEIGAIFIVVTTVLLSLAYYKFIERPLIKAPFISHKKTEPTVVTQ
ncbi:acyltransferase family protein [Pseudomonas paeninsulae]|uniref:acyltransferase family protein n=1 Tax=Pseudomonas paeninsulae TaxID=3110772 RepID=UPI002D79182D|nr:acyltransferase [Pseudomonas sp. IT1137]